MPFDEAVAGSGLNRRGILPPCRPVFSRFCQTFRTVVQNSGARSPTARRLDEPPGDAGHVAGTQGPEMEGAHPPFRGEGGSGSVRSPAGGGVGSHRPAMSARSLEDEPPDQQSSTVHVASHPSAPLNPRDP